MGRLLLAGGDAVAALPLLMKAALLHRDAAHYRAALSTLDAWDKAFEQADGAADSVDLAGALALRSHSLFKTGNFNAAEQVAMALVERGRAYGWPQLASGLNNLALAAAFRGDLRAATAFNDEVLSLENAPAHARWEALDQLGYRHRERGEFLEAEMAFERVMATSRGTERESSALLHIAVIHQMRGELERALELAERSLEIARAFSEPLMAVDAEYQVGVIFECMGRYPEARERFERVLEAYRRMGRANKTTNALTSLAELDRHTGRLAEAERGYREVLAVFGRMGWAQSPVAHANLGLVLIERGEFIDARVHMLRAERMLVDSGLHGWKGVVAGLAVPAWVDDAARFAALLATRHEALVSTSHCDRDVYRMLRLAATRALSLGEADRAGQALNAALAEAVALRDEREAADVRRALRRLG
jgi:tetratricopeptide (TPR) repeat protein